MSAINVTKSFLPPMGEYEEYLKRIWDSGILTNQGPLLREFERKASKYLSVENFHFVQSGTLAIQLALRALDITEGEIITTPFTYVATTSAILWERCTPVYVDIDPDNFCIDPDKIEEKITRDTKAILAVHVFGNPCDVEAIEKIAEKHKLKVIYDGAHAFGVTHNGKSLLDYGDVSICSFHATKVFHTIEGGCVITKNKKISERVELLKRFGHHGDDHSQLGINAKASELQAAMGLCNLKYVDESINRRKAISDIYSNLLSKKFKRQKTSPDTKHSYSYYPLVFENENDVKVAIEKLNSKDIYPRRYFYPSLNKLPYIDSEQECPVSEAIAETILCLPIYDGLDTNAVETICEELNSINSKGYA